MNMNTSFINEVAYEKEFGESLESLLERYE